MRTRDFWLRPSLLLPVILSCLASGVEAQTPSGAQLLQAMANADRMAQYSGVETVSQTGAKPIKMRIWRHGQQRRLEYLAPPITRGDLLVNNGTELWSYHRSENAVMRMPATGLQGGDGYGAGHTGKSLNARVVSKATVAGRPAWVVVVSPPGQSHTMSKFWIDAATKTRLRVERYGPSGQRLMAAGLETIKFGAVPASQFQWTPPAGAKVTQTSGTLYNSLEQARAGAAWVQYPHYIPPGYAFESAIVDAKGAAWLRYTNGLNRFSIFQQRISDNKNTGPRPVRGAWYWQRGGSRFLTVGVPAAQSSKVAGGVR